MTGGLLHRSVNRPEELSLVERAETVQVHFTHKGEGLKAQRTLHGWKVYMESYIPDYG